MIRQISILLNLGRTIFGAENSSGLTTSEGSLPSGFTRGHNFLTSLLGVSLLSEVCSILHFGAHCLRERYYNVISYLLFYINVTFLFSSVPEGHGLILALVIIFVLFLVIMGIAAAFVYRGWKKKSSKNGYNTPDEEVPMNPVTAQPTETVS